MATLQQLEARLDNLQRAFEQAMKNQVPLTAKTDNADGKIPAMDKQIADNTKGHAANEDAICEMSETTEDSIAALEQAICDLSEEIGG